MLMIDVLGERLCDDDIRVLSHDGVCGVILFGKNVKSPAQVRALVDEIRAIAPDLLIAVDQEGGRVRRLRDGFTPIVAMRHLGYLYQQDKQAALAMARDIGVVLGAECRAVGVDMTFAPVLDLDNGSDVIGDRAFSHDPIAVADLARAMVGGLGILYCVKHFLGHGSVKADTHHAPAVDTRADVFADLYPFMVHIDAPAMMPAHVIYAHFDDVPATYSSFWLNDTLRARLGYRGVVFSDDLCMAAADCGDMPKRVARALASGVDVALVCHNRAAVHEVLADMPITPMAFDKPSPLPWLGDVITTAGAVSGYFDARARVLDFYHAHQDGLKSDPTHYQPK